ncbi:fibrous sheath CABYR-binding protein isoform X1 [Oryzias melastigma]|uniref:fibrous sheath CABYR-binding protein isoform X1 n=1 Tax=Oryzias melastigma TaxID=30732 RepID=UPI000CF81B90|nr:fibrous sheath CABYR-binding protein isoform X1 [Oryzias melastigma]
MGCSSSSAQTVDQEKKPGTKPEETNGDTQGVRNGIVADDAKTIEDQMQLPVQTALPENLQTGAEDDGEPVLMAIEAQEDLGSGEDLLAAPEPQEAAPETAALAEDVSAEHPPVVEVLVESVQAEAPTATEEEAPAADAELAPSEPAEVLTVSEAVEPPAAVAQETPAVETAEALAEAAAGAPAEDTPPAEVLTVSEAVEPPAAVAQETPAVETAEAPAVETAEAPAEAAVGAPVEDAPPAEAQIPNSASEAALETPAEVLENKPDESSVPVLNVASVPAEPSEPVDEEPIVDAEIAAATVPEMPSSPAVSADAQAELHPPTEGGGASTATDDTEGTPEPEPDAVVEQFQNAEASSVSETLSEEAAASSVTSKADTETASVVEPSPIEPEELSSPEPAAGPDQEASADVSSFDQTLEEIHSGTAKKED